MEMWWKLLCLYLLLPPYPSIVIYCFRFTLLGRRGIFKDLYLTFPKYDSSYSTGQEQYVKITPKYIIGIEETWCCFKSSGISVNSHLYLILLKIYGYFPLPVYSHSNKCKWVPLRKGQRSLCNIYLIGYCRVLLHETQVSLQPVVWKLVQEQELG